MKRIMVLLIFILILTSVFVYQKEDDVFVLTKNNVCLDTWGGFGGNALGNVSFIDGRFVLWINDTQGDWGLSKLSRGIKPHYWGISYAPISEVKFTKFVNFLNAPELILTIGLKLIDYKNYTFNNSSMNVAIVLFFDGFKTPYQEKCYQTEIQFFSYYGDKQQSNQEWFFEWRNDSVAQFKLADYLKLGEYKEYQFSLNPYIKKMMDKYDLDHAQLKCIEIFTEAYKGYCKFEVYHAKLISSQKLGSTQFNIIFSGIFVIILALSLIISKLF